MREVFSRHYTNPNIGELLIARMQSSNPRTVLDMGIGMGSLIKPAIQRWGNAIFYGTDIDEKISNFLTKELPIVKFYRVNGLSSHFPKKVSFSSGDIDVAVCNPPYNQRIPVKGFEQLFEKTGLTALKNFKYISGDLVFLAYNLRFLRTGGELGIIMPDSILAGQDYQKLRENLVTNHRITSIIELPDNVFYKTEAKAHILILKAHVQSDLPTYITKSNLLGECDDFLFIEKDGLINRMDFKFLSYQLCKTKKNNSKPISDLDVDIVRGNLSKLELENLGLDFYHTTNIEKCFSTKNLRDDSIKNLRVAEEGDILISRVGKRCLGRIRIIKPGESLPFSDCLYRIRFHEKRHFLAFYNEFTSKDGIEWLNAVSHGTCSKVLSKSDLLKFEIPI